MNNLDLYVPLFFSFVGNYLSLLIFILAKGQVNQKMSTIAFEIEKIRSIISLLFRLLIPISTVCSLLVLPLTSLKTQKQNALLLEDHLQLFNTRSFLLKFQVTQNQIIELLRILQLMADSKPTYFLVFALRKSFKFLMRFEFLQVALRCFAFDS